MQYEFILIGQTQETDQKPNWDVDSTPGGALSDYFLSWNNSKMVFAGTVTITTHYISMLPS